MTAQEGTKGKPGPRLVGLTGGIGSGKSVVAAMLRALGADIIDADVLAKEAVAPQSPALDEIVRRFGEGVLMPDGTLDRRSLGRIVFSDPAARAVLNGIVHPRVAALAQERIARSSAEVVVYDVPLLYENGLEQGFSVVIVVSVRPDVQRARIRARDQLGEQEIEDRIGAQMPLEEKSARADFVVDNNGDIESTRRQVEAIWQSLTGGERT